MKLDHSCLLPNKAFLRSWVHCTRHSGVSQLNVFFCPDSSWVRVWANGQKKAPLLMCLFIYGSARSLLLRGLFSGCREQGLLSGWDAWASHCGDFFRCRAWALRCLGSVVVVCGLSYSCNFPGPRDQTCVPCIGMQTLYHWTTGEVQKAPFHYCGPWNYKSIFQILTCELLGNHYTLSPFREYLSTKGWFLGKVI